MGLGFSKVFVFVMFFAAAYAYYIRSINGFFVIVIPYAIIRVIWNIFTQK